MRISTAAAFALAASVLLVSPRAGFAEPPSADAEAVLQSTAAALGAKNLPKLAALRTHFTLTGLGLKGRGDAWIRFKPLATATYADLGPLSQDQGFDGREAWTRDDKNVVWVEGSVEGRSAVVNDAFRQSYALWTPQHGGAHVALVGDRVEKDRHFTVLRIDVPHSSVPFDLWIDATTHLPERFVETAASVTTTTKLDTYRSVRGVQIPFGQHATSSQGNQSDQIARSVDVDPAGVAAHVAKPVSNPHDYSISGGTTTTVPTRLIDNHVYLDVTLNGKGPYHFIFDTGGQNVLDYAVAKEIGAAPVGSMQGGGVGAATEGFSFAKVRSLGFGAAELRDQLFAVAPVRNGFGMAGSAPVDGLIGFEVLARFVTQFDYQNNQLVFSLPGGPAPQGRSVPFVFGGTQPEIACALDGIASLCSVDTGSRSSLDVLVPFLAAHPDIVPADASASGLNGFGVGGGQSGKLGRLRTLEIGGYTLRDMIAGLSVAQGGGFFGTGGIAANIGGGVWNRFTVTFDYPHRTMSLAPNANFERRDEYERAGLFVINKGGTFVAVDVRAGTPAAAAGLVKGDAIASLDGTPAAQLTLGTIRDAFHRPSGTVLHLGIVHAGASAPSDVTLTLRDFV